MIKKWFVTIPQLSGDMKRRVYVYLPDSYQKEPDKHYPVLYMFDGHNVFFDTDATYGKSWGMRDYMRKSKKQLMWRCWQRSISCLKRWMQKLNPFYGKCLK